jgi:hypothetical protein
MDYTTYYPCGCVPTSVPVSGTAQFEYDTYDFHVTNGIGSAATNMTGTSTEPPAGVQ